MAFISVESITKTYPSGTMALRDVSLQVNVGDKIAIVGPSGCGKTTLLNLLAGLDSPSAGQVVIDGRASRDASLTRAFVFQADAVFPWLTTAQNVAYPLRLRQLDQATVKRRLEDALRAVGLWEFRHAWPRELSGGMRKRVDLARAYALEAELLLLDEPFGSVDMLTRLELQDLLLTSVHQRSTTSILVTHDVDEALLFGDLVVVLTARPGTVHTLVPVSMPWPRDTSLRFGDEFGLLRRQVSAALGLHVVARPGRKAAIS